jgi:hypothetical protein
MKSNGLEDKFKDFSSNGSGCIFFLSCGARKTNSWIADCFTK